MDLGNCRIPDPIGSVRLFSRVHLCQHRKPNLGSIGLRVCARDIPISAADFRSSIVTMRVLEIDG